MEYHFYDKSHHTDGRIENFHYVVNNPDIVLDMLSNLKKKGFKIDFITAEQWEKEKADRVETNFEYEYPVKINLCDDIEEGDGKGPCVGYIEQYTLKHADIDPIKDTIKISVDSAEVISSMSTIVTAENKIYYFMPYWLEKTDVPGVFIVHHLDNKLPEPLIQAMIIMRS